MSRVHAPETLLAPEPVPVTAFKDAVGRFPSGVTVVATRRDGATTAKTVSAFSSLSLDPPLVSAAIGGGTPLADALREGGGFGISVLHDDQAPVSDWFARPSHTRDGAAPAGFVAPVRDDAPVLDRCLSWFGCRVAGLLDAGDHVVVVGEVLAVRVEPGAPLVHHAGRYRAVTPDHPPVPRPEEIRPA